MTIGTWNPAAEKVAATTYSLDMIFLKKITLFMEQNDEPKIASYLNASEQEQHCAIMTLPKENWFAVKENLSPSEIILLIKFFTLAEMTYTNWTGDEASPVIWLAKLLRQKGERIGADLLQWIKSNSDNKFLPYGAL